MEAQEPSPADLLPSQKILNANDEERRKLLEKLKGLPTDSAEYLQIIKRFKELDDSDRQFDEEYDKVHRPIFSGDKLRVSFNGMDYELELTDEIRKVLLQNRRPSDVRKIAEELLEKHPKQKALLEPLIKRLKYENAGYILSNSLPPELLKESTSLIGAEGYKLVKPHFPEINAYRRTNYENVHFIVPGHELVQYRMFTGLGKTDGVFVQQKNGDARLPWKAVKSKEMFQWIGEQSQSDSLLDWQTAQFYGTLMHQFGSDVKMDWFQGSSSS